MNAMYCKHSNYVVYLNDSITDLPSAAKICGNCVALSAHTTVHTLYHILHRKALRLWSCSIWQAEYRQYEYSNRFSYAYTSKMLL